MSPYVHYSLLFLFGAGVGAVSGMLGIGGGIALVPGLVLLFGFSQQEAQGTSLAVLIPPIGIFAALVYYQHGYIRLPVVGWLALGIMLGAYAGALFVPHLPVEVLRVGFGAMLIGVGVYFVMLPARVTPAVALPAAVATTAAVVVGKLVRRAPAARRRPPPPDDHTEYHI